MLDVSQASLLDSMLSINRNAPADGLQRSLRFDGQRALGFAEVAWFAVSLEDRDLFFRNGQVFVGSGVNAGSWHPVGIIAEL